MFLIPSVLVLQLPVWSVAMRDVPPDARCRFNLDRNGDSCSSRCDCTVSSSEKTKNCLVLCWLVVSDVLSISLCAIVFGCEALQ